MRQKRACNPEPRVSLAICSLEPRVFTRAFLAAFGVTPAQARGTARTLEIGLVLTGAWMIGVSRALMVGVIGAAPLSKKAEGYCAFQRFKTVGYP